MIDLELTKLEEILSTFLRKPARVAVVGVGNSLRSDDFVGVAVVQKLKQKVQKDAVLFIEADTAPTSFFHEIQEWNPSHLLIIDAADFGADPGAVNLIKREQITTFTLTSHKRSFTLLIDLIAHYLPDLKIEILVIQPLSVEFNAEINISPNIQDVLEKLVNILELILSKL